MEPIVFVVPFAGDWHRASLAVGERIVHVIGPSREECHVEADKYAGRVSRALRATAEFQFGARR